MLIIAKNSAKQISTSDLLVKVLQYYGLFEDQEKYKIICPFHEDINASLLVDLQQGKWFCFGCQKGGQAIDFVKYSESNLNEIQVWQLYFKIQKGEIKQKRTYKRRTKQQIIEEDQQKLIEAQDYYFNLSTIDWREEDNDIKDYLLDRGLSIKTLNKVKAKLTYNDSYPVVFPMKDMGEFKGYVCRTTNKEIEKKRKYLYNKGFSRSNTLVGRYNNHTVFMVEGFIDYLKARQLGVKFAVAILGWKITQQQIEKLKLQGVKNIISALDNDECGIKGTIYLQNFFNVIRFIYPKNIKDIGEMNQNQFDKAKEKTLKFKRRLKNGSIGKHEKGNCKNGRKQRKINISEKRHKKEN